MLNIYPSCNKASKYIKHQLIKLQEEIGKLRIKAAYFDPPS